MAVRCMWKKRPTRLAGWFASASGMVTTGATAASKSATDSIDQRDIQRAPISKPGRCSAGFYFGLAHRAHRIEHRFARPAIDLQPRGFLIRPQRGTGLHSGLAVQLVLVEADAGEMTLHRLHRRRA